jgi:hypothetical protein
MLPLALVLAALPASSLPIRITTGWLTVVDLKGLQHAASADPSIASVLSAKDDQLLLLGAEPGETIIYLTANGERSEQPVTVGRGTSLRLDSGFMKLSVGSPMTLKAVSLRRALIGDGLLCDAAVSSADALELTPRRPGMTNLFVWTGGVDALHRHEILVLVESGGVSRSADDLDAVLTEPLTGRLVLITGEHAILDLPPAARFAINDPSVAIASASPRGELVIDARAAGATFLRTFTGSGVPRSTFVVVHAHSPGDPPEDDDSGLSTSPRLRGVRRRRPGNCGTRRSRT